MAAQRTLLTNVSKKCFYAKPLSSNASLSAAYRQLHVNKQQPSKIYILCVKLHKLYSKWFEIILAVCLHLF